MYVCICIGIYQYLYYIHSIHIPKPEFMQKCLLLHAACIAGTLSVRPRGWLTQGFVLNMQGNHVGFYKGRAVLVDWAV